MNKLKAKPLIVTLLAGGLILMVIGMTMAILGTQRSTHSAPPLSCLQGRSCAGDLTCMNNQTVVPCDQTELGGLPGPPSDPANPPTPGFPMPGGGVDVGRGGNFLPYYLQVLQGKPPLTDDLSCPPAHDLRSLLLPCDTP
jgi:hypothetical protein